MSLRSLIRKRRIVILAAVILVIGLLHGPLLRALARPLVADEQGGDARYIVILASNHGPSGYRCYDVAADLHRAKPGSKIVVVDQRCSRLVETGVLPSFEVLSRKKLASRGVASKAISAIPSDGNDAWAAARGMRRWLAQHPEASAIILCSGFRSAYLRHTIDSVMTPADAARVRIRPLFDPAYDAGNWWTSRVGIKAFGFGWLRMLHAWCFRAGDVPPRSAGADEYESTVRRALVESRI